MNEGPEIPFGSFRPAPEESSETGPESESIEAESKPDLVAKYSLFRDGFKPKADVVYHPCSANDVSPSFGFPESRVIYVDIDERPVAALQKSGYEAHVASALEFDPGKVDILIMLNPQIPPDVPSSHVVENGFVLCNDYHGTASSLHGNDHYQQRAVVREVKGRTLVLDTERLENCWKEVETDEEFKNARFSFGTAQYANAASLIEAITGKREHVLTEYKKLVAAAREEQRQRNAQLVREHPERANTIVDPDEEEIIMLNHQGKEFMLETAIPKKKGTADDIFVFQKVKPNQETIHHSP